VKEQKNSEEYNKFMAIQESQGTVNMKNHKEEIDY